MGVWGEGGGGRRNALRGEWVRRRAGKRLASVSDVRSDTGITPVSDSSDCRRELKSVPPATRRETSSSEQMPTERAREHPRRREREPAKKSRVYVLLTVYFVLLNTLLWLVTPDFLVLPSLILEPCYKELLACLLQSRFKGSVIFLIDKNKQTQHRGIQNSEIFISRCKQKNNCKNSLFYFIYLF